MDREILTTSADDSKMKIDLKVNRATGTGRYTLTQRLLNERMPSDCHGELSGNTDAGRFYRAVAQKIADLQTSGYEVQYRDCSLPI